ncbi:MAG: PP2C family protein-serine/threonine phosphatase [Lachnospiraceae bacterium]|nr:PP2C family protein-serine/threonine phosphatase [Lachnospiraceae bacterium]
MKSGKTKYSLGNKIRSLVILTVILVAGAMLATAFIIYGMRTEQHYKQWSEDIARTVAAHLDGDLYEQLEKTFETEEFRQLRVVAEAADNGDMVLDYLEERGLKDAYLQEYAHLGRLLKTMHYVKWVYVFDFQDANALVDYAVLDSDEPYYYSGSPDDREDVFMGVLDNDVSVPATVTHTEWGWLSSAYSPVYNSAGEAVASVGVDIDMDEIMAEKYGFLGLVALAGIIVAVIMSILAVRLTNRVVISPLDELTEEMKKFAPTAGASYREAGVLQKQLGSRDEIAELYDNVTQMQKRIVDYLGSITTLRNERSELETELNVAAQIQKDMLPAKFPAFPGRGEFDVYAMMIPAKEIGGDFYDFFLIDDDHLGLAIGDIHSKGVPAALYMAITKTLIQGRAMQGGEPGEVLSTVNRQLCGEVGEQIASSAWFGILTISTGELRYANAGHEYPALMHSNQPYALLRSEKNIDLGVDEEAEFTQNTTVLSPGDCLFLYTDGIPGARSAENREFGTEQMLSLLNLNISKDTRKRLDTVKRELDNFTSRQDPYDDITMLELQYFGVGEYMIS